MMHIDAIIPPMRYAALCRNVPHRRHTEPMPKRLIKTKDLKDSHKHPLSDFYDEETSGDEIDNLLWSFRIKATAPRKALAELLFDEKKPLSFFDIIKKVKGQNGQSRASIYRTLELFMEKGLVHTVNTGSRLASFEFIHGRKHHHHVICTSCGDLEDIDTCQVVASNRVILEHSKKFMTIDYHSLEFFGICKKCKPMGYN